MIVKRFTSEDIKDITCAEDFYKAVGFDADEFRKKDVFGNKANYRNFFISPRTDTDIRLAMSQNVEKLVDRCGSKTRARTMQSMDWSNFAPICNGPRYDEVEQAVERIIDNALYILTPGDELYEEANNG